MGQTVEPCIPGTPAIQAVQPKKEKPGMVGFVDMLRFRFTFGFWPFAARDSKVLLAVKARLEEMSAERDEMLSSAQRELAYLPCTYLEVARHANVEHQLELAADRVYRARALARRLGYDPSDLARGRDSLSVASDPESSR